FVVVGPFGAEGATCESISAHFPGAEIVIAQGIGPLAGLAEATRPVIARVRAGLVFHSARLLEQCDGERGLVAEVAMRRPGVLLDFPLPAGDWAWVGPRAELERVLRDSPATVAELTPAALRDHEAWLGRDVAVLDLYTQFGAALPGENREDLGVYRHE